MRTVLAILIVILVPIILTAVAAFLAPILFKHGSSAAFNAGCALVLAAGAAWVGGYLLLFGGRRNG